MSGLTDEERELKRLAEAATPGPWVVVDGVREQTSVALATDHDWDVCDASGVAYDDYGAPTRPASLRDAAFIAAANPATVLRLLARIEELEGRLLNDDYRFGLQRWCEKPVVDATGKHGGPCSLGIGHDGGCEHWVSGRHHAMTKWRTQHHEEE